MDILDCLGDACPIPLMKLQACKSLKEKGSSVMLVTDHSCVCESVTQYCKKRELTLRIEEPINGVWEMYIHRA